MIKRRRRGAETLRIAFNFSS